MNDHTSAPQQGGLIPTPPDLRRRQGGNARGFAKGEIQDIINSNRIKDIPND